MGVHFACLISSMLMKWKANQKLQSEGKQHQQLSLTFKSTLMFTNRYLGMYYSLHMRVNILGILSCCQVQIKSRYAE